VAADVLADVLVDGPIHWSEIASSGADSGVSESSLRRAAKRMGVIMRDGYWSLSCSTGQSV